MQLGDYAINREPWYVNITLGGTKCPGSKLLRFVLHEKTAIATKTHQLISRICTTIWGVKEPY